MSNKLLTAISKLEDRALAKHLYDFANELDGAIDLSTENMNLAGTLAVAGATSLAGALDVVGASTVGPASKKGIVTLARKLTLTPTAAANTDLTLTMPSGCLILEMDVYTTTAFTGNTVNLSVGTTAGGAELVAATDIKAAGKVSLALKTTAMADATNLTTSIYARIIQTATVTAVGSGILVVRYIIN